MFFAIQAVEATDVASNEQMCVSVCWVSKEYEIFEEPIGIVKVTKQVPHHLCNFERCSVALYFAS